VSRSEDRARPVVHWEIVARDPQRQAAFHRELFHRDVGAGPVMQIPLERHPALLDKSLLSRHYSSRTLASPPARTGWVEPDLVPFPWSPRRPGQPPR